MAKLADDHQGAVTTVEYNDFRGGLNTTVAPELIAKNELAKAINVEIDSTSGSLKTVAGTDDVYTKEQANGVKFNYLMYDSIGSYLLLTDTNFKVYAMALNNTSVLTEVGTLSGTETVEYTAWEDGIVICSGGALQYFHGGTLETITDTGAPTVCHCPFIKDGRIYLAIGDELHCSAIGDEHSWATDDNVPSSAQWLQIGYKDGGSIVGLGALSSDIVIFKNNNRAYHLAGSYPDWSLSEIGRQIDCKGFNGCVSLADQILALGATALQTIRVTDEYGDMKASNISSKVQKDIAAMGKIRMRYIPSLNQVWLINGTKRFFFVDINNGGFFQREYFTEIYDVVEANDNTVYVLKAGKLCKLNSKHMNDEGAYLRWRMQGQTLTTINQFLVKRAWVDTTPYFENYIESLFLVDKITLLGAVPTSARCIWHDYTHIFRSTRDVCGGNTQPVFINSDEVYSNPDYIYGNDTQLKSYGMYRNYLRQIDRGQTVKLQGYGSGGPFLVNDISYNVAEV